MSLGLVIQHALRMRRFILSSVLCLVWQYVSTSSQNRHDFRKEVIEHKMGVLIFATILSQTSLILRRIQRDIVINVKSLHLKYSLFLSGFNET
jgi:hypothetical protein